MIASIFPVSQLCSLGDNIPHSLLTHSLFNSESNGKSYRTVFSHPSCQWVVLCSIGSVDQGLNWHLELIGELDKSPLSNVLTTPTVALKENWTTASGANSLWCLSETGGKLKLSYLNSPTCYIMWHSMLVEGSRLKIEIHRKHSQLRKMLTREPGPEEGPLCKAKIKFDDIRKHLSSRTDREDIFTSIAPYLLRGPQRTSR